MKKDFKDFQEDIIDLDSENYRSGQGESRKSIVMENYKRCCVEGSKEMTQSGIVTRVIDGRAVEVAVPDQIEIFANSVEMLKASLMDKVNENPDLMKEYLGVYEELEKTKEDYTVKAKQTIDEQANVSSNRRNVGQQFVVAGIIERLRRSYELKRLLAYRKLFVGLSLLLGRLNYFDEMGVTKGYE